MENGIRAENMEHLDLIEGQIPTKQGEAKKGISKAHLNLRRMEKK